jgi:hypothetical protein
MTNIVDLFLTIKLQPALIYFPMNLLDGIALQSPCWYMGEAPPIENSTLEGD